MILVSALSAGPWALSRNHRTALSLRSELNPGSQATSKDRHVHPASLCEPYHDPLHLLDEPRARKEAQKSSYGLEETWVFTSQGNCCMSIERTWKSFGISAHLIFTIILLVGTIITLILQSRHRVAKEFAWGHTADPRFQLRQLVWVVWAFTVC